MGRCVFVAPDISCDGCARSIQKALGTVAGVRKVEVNVAEKKVVVDYGEGSVAPTELLRVLDEAGFPASLESA